MITVITNIKPTKKLDIEEIIIFVLKILNVDNVSIAVSYNKEICDKRHVEGSCYASMRSCKIRSIL